MKDHKYNFTGKVWMYPGPATWYFVSLPKDVSVDICNAYVHLKAGFGSLPVDVCYKDIKWKTSIFPDKKEAAYILPLKKEIRVKGEIKEGDEISIEIIIKIN